MDFTDDDIRSLATKLEAMNLSDGERAALAEVLDAASDEDVAGFAMPGGADLLGTLGSITGRPGVVAPCGAPSPRGVNSCKGTSSCKT